jgi:hypothetical protein
MIAIAPHMPDRPIPLNDRDPARVIAIPRTGRQHHLINLIDHIRPCVAPIPGSFLYDTAQHKQDDCRKRERESAPEVMGHSSVTVTFDR